MRASTTNPSQVKVEVQDEAKTMRKVVFASVFGTALETYDLYLYGTAAALIFAPLFFPAHDAAVARLLSLATFAISFISRPVGSVVLGHFGDRIGRKKLLFLTLFFMGLSTVLIGVLPTYTTAGITAPLMLCVLRFVQGFAFAGEFSGAVLMLMEHAPPQKRAFYAGLNNIGPVFGLILSSGLLLFVNSTLSPEDFLSWGWRIPFLASALLLAVGLYVRKQVPESPVFEAAAKRRALSKEPTRMPLTQLFTKYRKELLLASGANICHFATFYLFTVFALSYGRKELGLSNTVVLSVVMLAVCTHLVAIPYAAARSDRVGRKKALITGFLTIAATIFPFWAMFNTGNFFLMLIGSSALMIGYAFVYGPITTFTGEAFGPSARFTGSAIAYNIGGILGGGSAPIVAALLLGKFHSPYPIGVYIVILAFISIICVALSKETNKSDLLEDRGTE